MTADALRDPATDARARTFAVQRVRAGGMRADDDRLAVEEPLEIRLQFWTDDGERRRLQQKALALTMRTPGHDDDLAVGFLVSEGVIRAPSDVVQVQHCPVPDELPSHNVLVVRLAETAAFDPKRLERHFYTTSSCGVCGKTSLEALEVTGCPVLAPGPRLAPETIHALPATLRAAQAVFEETGGLHAAALFDAAGTLLRVREDVGRHNAVDKLVGSYWREGSAVPSETMLLVSGRASFELAQKALMAGISVLAAVGAPSSLAVELAARFGMTAAGLRPRRAL